MRVLRILIVDDHALVRRGAREVLNSRRGWKVVGEAAEGFEAIEKAVKLRPDVAIIDISIPSLNGIEVARRILKAAPEIKVLILTMDESDQMVRRALDAGAQGYVLKSDLTDSLPKAVKAISEGKRFLTPRVSEIVLEGFLGSSSQDQEEHRSDVALGLREIEITRLVAEGKSSKEIAVKLGIAVRTVETHRFNIMHKLNLHSVAELIHYAVRRGITTTK